MPPLPLWTLFLFVATEFPVPVDVSPDRSFSVGRLELGPYGQVEQKQCLTFLGNMNTDILGLDTSHYPSLWFSVPLFLSLTGCTAARFAQEGHFISVYGRRVDSVPVKMRRVRCLLELLGD